MTPSSRCSRRRFAGCRLTLLIGLLVWPGNLGAEQNEIDVFMERVLERRDENWVELHEYVLDERETFRVVGPAGIPLQSFDREYSWYVRDSFLIRSPLRFDGVAISETERRLAEEDWLRQERRRAENPTPGRGRRPRSTRGSFANIMLTVERQWGRRIGDDLGRELAEDARLWRDDAAAIVNGTDRIVRELGGVEEVGFGLVAARLRDAFVMLDGGRLERPQVGRLMSVMIPMLTAALPQAPDTELERLVELIQLTARADLLSAELTAELTRARTSLEGRGYRAFADRLADAQEVAGPAIGAATPRTSEAPAVAEPNNQISIGMGLQPRFVSESYFLDFQFEPGNYYFAGRDEVAGREVVKIEYYPKQLFSDPEDDPSLDSREDQIDAGFDKTSLVTMWIDPDEHQIVKFTFDNVGFDFLPMRWLVRLDDLTASMVMSQPFEGVWLPEAVELNGRLTLATGSFDVTYSRAFFNYRQAETRARIRSYGTPQD